MPSTLTAFVSHSDCARHDTGWKHPDHQGRLPALVRAVYRDMLTLHGHLLEVEARHATPDDLELVHSAEWVRGVEDASRQAGAADKPRPLRDEVVVSGASWLAARAAAGAALTGVDAVLDGAARNAFCASRPMGYAAAADAPGGFALFNNVAIAARHLRRRCGIQRLLVVEWGGVAPSAIAPLLADDPGIRVLTVRQPAAGAGLPDRPGAHTIVLPPGTRGDLFRGAFEAELVRILDAFTPEFVLLAAGFDLLDTDPLGVLSLEPADVHPLTALVRDAADRTCGGRLVSVLEGGYDPPALGLAVVQHIRALAGLPPA
jgi:acetoin utilization deacetylase AcuC-like enzyme